MNRRLVFLVCCSVLTAALPSIGTSAQSGEAADLAAPGATIASGRAVYFSSGGAASRKDGETMREQALANMKRLEANVAQAGFRLSDVVFVRAYLTPGSGGVVDYAGWDLAWRDVFGSAGSARKPARTTVAVPMLNANGGLIELEYVCVTEDGSKMASGSEALALPVTNANLKPYGTKEGRIYAGMGIVPGSALYWTSGNNPPVLDSSAPMASFQHRGDMYTQARNTLTLLKQNLTGVGLSLSDVVYVRAYLGPDAPTGEKFDFDGWNKAYGEFFNNPEQRHKPARVTVTTPTFAGNAGGRSSTMIEIEFVAAFPSVPSLFDTPDPGNAALRTYGGAGNAMVAAGVAVKPRTRFYLSGGTTAPIEGDMKVQALAVLETLRARLAAEGMSFQDVIFLRAYVVPAANGMVDRDGWNAAYTVFFNNAAQPHKPARVTIPVVSLPEPASKIAIDLIAARP